MSGSRQSLLILVLLSLALGLRVWSIDFGLPFSYSTDEYHEVMRALELASGSFNFDRVGKGGLYFVLLVEYGLYFVVLLALGGVGSIHEFALHFVRDQTPFYLMGRWTVAVLGTINVFAVYLLARKAYSHFAGLFAAAFLTVNTLHVYESHTINVDIPMVTMVTFALLYAVKTAESGQSKNYYLAALLSGVAVTTKLTAIFLIIPLLLSHVLYCRRSGSSAKKMLLNRQLWISALIMIGVVVTTNPGIVRAFPWIVSSALESLLGIGGPADSGMQVARELSPNLHAYYFPRILDSMGWPMFVAVVLSIVYASWKRTQADLILLSFGLVIYLVLTGPIAGDKYYARYLLPVIMVAVVLAGRMFGDLLCVDHRPAARLATVGALLVLLIIPGYQSVIQNCALAGPDTRDLAKQWIESNVPQGAYLLIEGGKIAPVRTTVQLEYSLDAIERRIKYWKDVEPRQAKVLELRREIIRQRSGHARRTFDLLLVPPGDLRDLESYRAQGVEYFVLRPRKLRSRRGGEESGVVLLDELRRSDHAELIYSIDPVVGEGVRGGGPRIEVYRLDPS